MEQRKKGQFQDTLEQLKVYSLTIYKKEIKQLKALFTQLTLPVLVKPEAPKDKNKDDTMYKEECTVYLKDKKSLDTTLVSLYNVVWGQCSRLMQNKLNSNPKFVGFDDTSDVASLLTEIKLLSNTMEENISAYDALHKAKIKFYRYQ